MKLTTKIIESAISEVAGEDIVPLVTFLKGKENVSEFVLADAIGQEVNITRNMLYRLYDVNLVSFIRKKDKTKGWYIYYWTFDDKRLKYIVIDLKKKRIERLSERLKREEANQFFICDEKCIRLDFEQAVNFEFKCPECGTLLNQEDNAGKILDIRAEIAELEKEIVEEEERAKAQEAIILAESKKQEQLEEKKELEDEKKAKLKEAKENKAAEKKAKFDAKKKAMVAKKKKAKKAVKKSKKKVTKKVKKKIVKKAKKKVFKKKAKPAKKKKAKKVVKKSKKNPVKKKSKK